MLRKALSDAVEGGYVGCNVADLANPPTQRAAGGRLTHDKAWTSAQLRAFLDAVTHDRLAPAWQLVATTGLRRAELCGRRWSDVELEQGATAPAPARRRIPANLADSRPLE